MNATAGKLDQSLEEIVKTSRAAHRGALRGRGRRARSTIKAGVVASVGGILKSAANAKANGKVVHPAVSTTGSGESKIIVSGLPSDVSEEQIKEYFAKTIGPVKKVFLTYGPNGQSRGVSTVVFTKSSSALEAATTLNGVKVDNRAMKIEVVVGANQASAPVPAKTLGDRINQAKTVGRAQTKPATIGTRGGSTGVRGRGSGRARRGRNAGRPKPKTADQLDAEMTDYFDGGANGAAGGEDSTRVGANGARYSIAATGGDTGMVDEIL